MAPAKLILTWLPGFCLALTIAACSSFSSQDGALTALPAPDAYCLEAQRIVTRTDVPMQLVVHSDFDAFVKSKAVIEGPTIHQYNWLAPDSSLQGISCKMKSADHLNRVYGDGAAGPDGYCHDMNREVYRLLLQSAAVAPAPAPVFDLSESLDTPEQAGMIGPVWLLPFTLTYVDGADVLHIATKGFTIDFDDPRYQKFPDSWRGTHYCHLIAPDYLQALLNGTAEAGVVIGRAAKERRLPASVKP